MAYIDQYCERLAPGLLAEPMNAATNAAFFLAAWVVWRHAQRTGAAPAASATLVALMVAIGVGSTIFHTVASTAARWGDLIPILLFQLAFLWLYARRVLRWSAAGATTLAAGFLAVALYARTFPELLNGSLTYAPSLAVIAALGLHHYAAHRNGRTVLLAAAAVLAVAIALRTLDEAVCDAFPLGTHFLWHLLTPVVLWLCARGLLANLPRARAD